MYDKHEYRFSKLLLLSIVIALNYSVIFSLYLTENMFFTLVMTTFNTLFCVYSMIEYSDTEILQEKYQKKI
jgi:hypothetical protein